MNIKTLAQWEHVLAPFIAHLPAKMVISNYSQSRLDFLKKLTEEIPTKAYQPPEHLARTLWGIRFRSSIMNAAGMFKNGECYDMIAMQGAGAYLGGTGTWNARKGNEKENISLPFVAYRKSHAASNWLGLPNNGDTKNFLHAQTLGKMLDCPIGWSVMGSPDYESQEKMNYLVSSMCLYQNAGVDFLEINESCPNTEQGKPQDSNLAQRLQYIKEHFLEQRSRRLPVIVKFSNDTQKEQLPFLLDLLFSLGYDGVNFGNTSTQYALHREKIVPPEQKIYDYFTSTFGGGVSGRPLNESSLELASRAVEYRNAGYPPQEFHVIRTGGIETLADLQASAQAGISLNQWFTGYFENFAYYGHDVYKKLLSLL